MWLFEGVSQQFGTAGAADCLRQWIYGMGVSMCGLVWGAFAALYVSVGSGLLAWGAVFLMVGWGIMSSQWSWVLFFDVRMWRGIWDLGTACDRRIWVSLRRCRCFVLRGIGIGLCVRQGHSATR